MILCVNTPLDRDFLVVLNISQYYVKGLAWIKHDQTCTEIHLCSSILIQEIREFFLPFLTVIHQGVLQGLKIRLDEIDHNLAQDIPRWLAGKSTQ